MKNKGLILFSVLAVLLLLASGCSKAPTGGAVSGKETVKVGVIAPLTGEVATIGVSAVKAIELAAEEFNARSKTTRIQLVLEDAKCEGAISAKAANKLINVDKVEVILGGLCSAETIAAAPVAETSGVVLFSGCSTAPSITGLGDFVFRDAPSDAYQGVFTANYMYDELGKRKAAIIYSNTDWGFGITKSFSKEFERLGGQVVAVDSIEQESNDVRSQLLKANSKNPDIIYTPMYSQNQGLTAKQAKEMGIKAMIMGADAAKDPNTVLVGGDAVEGFMFVALKAVNAPEFEKKLKEQKNVNIELCTPTAYDGANIAFNAIEAVGNSAEKVRDYLYNVKNYNGVSGNINLDSNGDRIEAEYSVFKVVNGEFVVVI